MEWDDVRDLCGFRIVEEDVVEADERAKEIEGWR